MSRTRRSGVLRTAALRTPSSLLTLLLLTLALFSTIGCSVPAASLKAGPITESVQKGIRSGKKTFSHDGFDRLLKKHVRASGRVDYAGLKKDKAELDKYLKSLDTANVASLNRNELLAFLINAYNAYTLDVIVRNYPTDSIKKISKPWDTDFARVGGNAVSLNFIEHSLLRPRELFDDPRMHFAINCASIGCPLLRAGAYTGKDIDKQLDEAVRRCLADERYAKVDGDKVRVTKVLDWFKGDFDAKYGSLDKFLVKYLPAEASAVVKKGGAGSIAYFSYDWGLNDTPKKK